jgi:hypothetical protein
MSLVPVPIFNGDVATSVFGVMRFPEDLNKARLYASWRLAKVTQSNDAALLRRVAKEAAEFAPYYFDVGKAEVAGTAVGAITSAMVRLICCIRRTRHGSAQLSSCETTMEDYRPDGRSCRSTEGR